MKRNGDHSEVKHKMVKREKKTRENEVFMENQSKKYNKSVYTEWDPCTVTKKIFSFRLG